MAEGHLSAFTDHSSPMTKWGTKIGIDATKTWPEEGHTRENSLMKLTCLTIFKKLVECKIAGTRSWFELSVILII